jgi:homospermidine synthase
MVLPYLSSKLVVRRSGTATFALDDRGALFPETVDESDPWQFSNVLVA